MPVIHGSVLCAVVFIIIIPAESAGGQAFPCKAVGYPGYFQSIAVGGCSEVFGHPLILAGDYCFINVPVNIGDFACIQGLGINQCIGCQEKE